MIDKGADKFMCFDLTDAYFQIKVAEESQHLLAFMAPLGKANTTAVTTSISKQKICSKGSWRPSRSLMTGFHNRRVQHKHMKTPGRSWWKRWKRTLDFQKRNSCLERERGLKCYVISSDWSPIRKSNCCWDWYPHLTSGSLNWAWRTNSSGPWAKRRWYSSGQ